MEKDPNKEILDNIKKENFTVYRQKRRWSLM